MAAGEAAAPGRGARRWRPAPRALGAFSANCSANWRKMTAHIGVESVHNRFYTYMWTPLAPPFSAEQDGISDAERGAGVRRRAPRALGARRPSLCSSYFEFLAHLLPTFAAQRLQK